MIRTEMDSMPTELDEINRKIMQHEIEETALKKETDKLAQAHLAEIQKELAELRDSFKAMKAKWENEKQSIDKVRRLREEIEQVSAQLEKAENEYDLNRAAELKYGRLPALRRELEAQEALAEQAEQHATLLRDKVTEGEIARIVARWTGIPVAKLMEGERDKLLHLDEILHKRVIGQDDAVQKVTDAILRSRAGIRDPEKPIGSFLFLGPTGVGKTELAKALAQALFGSEEALIRFDMSEFGERHTASRLTGSPPGYVGHEEGGQLTEAVRRHPYSVLLFDELEKAHPDVWNLLLQIMEDGILTDSQGRRASFGSTVLIMTSNVGGEALSTGVPLGFSGGQAGKTVQSAALQRELRQVFRPEFLGRLDEIVTFHPLDEGELETVARKLLTAFAHRLSASGIDFLPSDQAIRCLVRQGKTEQRYGARPLRRLIRTQVEDPAADLLLRQAVTAGGTLYLEEDEGQLVLSPLV